MRFLLLVLAGCGAKSPVPSPAAPAPLTITSPKPAMKLRYRTCSNQGQVAVESMPGPAASWKTRPATEQDLTHARTIEGRIPIEAPAWVGERGDVTVRATGMDRTAFDASLARFGTPTASQVIAGHRLPWGGSFDGISFEGTDEVYVARFSDYSVWGGMAGRPVTAIAGAPFRWGRFDQPQDDRGGGPLIPGWHGEVFIGRVVFTVDAAGNNADEATFLAFADQVIRAALVDPDPDCRSRPGRWGTGYVRSPTDVVQLIGSTLQVQRNGARAVIGVGDDGTIRENNRPIGQISTNGYVFRWIKGTPELVGVVDSRGQFTYEATKQVIAIDLTTADRAGYRGDPAGRLMAALALLI